MFIYKDFFHLHLLTERIDPPHGIVEMNELETLLAKRRQLVLAKEHNDAALRYALRRKSLSRSTRSTPHWNDSVDSSQSAQLLWSPNGQSLLMMQHSNELYQYYSGRWKRSLLECDGDIVGLQDDGILLTLRDGFFYNHDDRIPCPRALVGNWDYSVEHDVLLGWEGDEYWVCRDKRSVAVRTHHMLIQRVIVGMRESLCVQDEAGLTFDNTRIDIKTSWTVLQVRDLVGGAVWVLWKTENGVAVEVFRRGKRVFYECKELSVYCIGKNCIYGFNAIQGRIQQLSLADLREESYVLQERTPTSLSTPFNMSFIVTVSYEDGTIEVLNFQLDND